MDDRESATRPVTIILAIIINPPLGRVLLDPEVKGVHLQNWSRSFSGWTGEQRHVWTTTERRRGDHR